MKIIPSILLFLVFTPNAFSQDISGSWRWYEEEDKSFEIYLAKADSTFQERFDFVGTHCGVYQNGNRMDCAVEDNSIFIKQQSENSFSGKIKSAYSLTEFEIRLTYLEAEKKILWEVTKVRRGAFLFSFKSFSRIDKGRPQKPSFIFFKIPTSPIALAFSESGNSSFPA